MKPDDFITFTNNDFGFERKIKVKVTRATIYNTFRDYLKSENIEKMPTMY
jgi:ASC-1-like (ASCH) protein